MYDLLRGQIRENQPVNAEKLLPRSPAIIPCFHRSFEAIQRD